MEHELTLAMYRDRLDEIEALRAELAEAEARGYQRAIDELLAAHEAIGQLRAALREGGGQ